MKDAPAIVVVTPVRNEAWVLDAFLTCASSWADYIIVADQHSTDGSREIAAKYEKVILVDNDTVEMDQSAARMLLFQEADKIKGDKIVFALDADEFLSEGFEKTEGWKQILNSSPNVVFCFKWINLYGDYSHEVPNPGYMEWACHFTQDSSIAEEYRCCETRAVHEARIPCICNASYVQIPDVYFVHLARLNLARQKNKEDFYQVSSEAKLHNRISAITLYRAYHQERFAVESLQNEVALCQIGNQRDVKGLIRLDDVGQYYIEEMKAIFMRDGYRKYLKLDIWDNPYLKAAGVNPRLPLRYRLLHRYLRKTQKASNQKHIRLIDKVLKLFV